MMIIQNHYYKFRQSLIYVGPQQSRDHPGFDEAEVLYPLS